MSNFICDKLFTLFDPIFQEAIDEAIEQHRLNGIAIAQIDEHGNVIEIRPEDIIPLDLKLWQRQNQQDL
ncbi:hypothetical protein NIES4102_42010 (plasmid) [Chondrocystis sp. NIES-4102]|nr:hypothetical protein NIES4102_42010 [Chondrocystis sp. NIES-4102]